MKKNKMMRLASLLLVCVLLSTSVISGTFAKYVTTKSGSDSARVAEWGVNIAVTNASELFKLTYNADTSVNDEKGNEIGLAVSGEAAVEGDKDADVVAPGTTGTMTFSVTGAPEVAANVSVTFGTIQMITLPANSVEIGEDSEGNPTKNAVYYPIKWTLKRSDAAITTAEGWTADKVVAIGEGENQKKLQGVTLADIKAYFESEETGINGNYVPNTNLASVFGYYQLTWEWAFDGTEAGADIMDTYLGDQMVNHTDENVKLNESFSLNITVTQIN